MGTIRTRRVDIIAQPRQQNLPVAKVDFFPENRVDVRNERWMRRVSSAIRATHISPSFKLPSSQTASVFIDTILEAGGVVDGR